MRWNHWLSCLFCLCLTQTGWAIDTLYLCTGEAVILQAPPNRVDYSWSPRTALSNPFIPTPFASPTRDQLYIVESIDLAPNLIPNGDFEQGNTGFVSNHRFTSTATNDQGVYGIFSDPSVHNPAFGSCPDHTTGDGLMMTVDAHIIPDQTAWCSEVPVIPNTTYIFSAWMTSLVSTSPGVLSFNINGAPIGQTLNVNSIVCNWQQFYAEWNSGAATTATICLNNENTEPFGNDFALDDIYFAERLESVMDTFQVIVLPSYSELIDTQICINQTLTYNGEDYPANTNREFRFTTAQGCDSIVQLRIGVLDTTFQAFRVDTLCPGDTVRLFGEIFTQDTLVCNTFSSVNACDSTICTQIVFLTENALVLDINDPGCSGATDGTIDVAVEAGLPPFTFFWEDGNMSPSRIELEEGDYLLTITDSKGCTVATSIGLTAPEAVSFTAVGLPTACAGEESGGIVVSPLGGTAPFSWTIDGKDFITDNQRNDLAAGNYLVQLRDANGCSAPDVFVTITSPTPVLVDVPDTLEFRLGDQRVIPTWTNAIPPVDYFWAPNLEISCTDCPDPLVRPTESGQYEVMVLDGRGCTATDSVFLAVNKTYQVFIPNVFSPNEDGTNDRFRLFPSQEVAIIRRFLVFDRWGGLLYEAQDCDPIDPNCSWDGLMKGEEVVSGVYVYLFEVGFLDGRIEMFSGDVTVIR